MSYKKVHLYDDLSTFVEIIDNRLREINKNKDITLPTEDEYKELIRHAIEKISGVARCQGIYVSGKHKGEQCRSPPQDNSIYCRKHEKKEDPEKVKEINEFKETKLKISELNKKAEEELDPEKKKLYEIEAMELLKTIKIV